MLKIMEEYQGLKNGNFPDILKKLSLLRLIVMNHEPRDLDSYFKKPGLDSYLKLDYNGLDEDDTVSISLLFSKEGNIVISEKKKPNNPHFSEISNNYYISSNNDITTIYHEVSEDGIDYNPTYVEFRELLILLEKIESHQDIINL